MQKTKALALLLLSSVTISTSFSMNNDDTVRSKQRPLIPSGDSGLDEQQESEHDHQTGRATKLRNERRLPKILKEFGVNIHDLKDIHFSKSPLPKEIEDKVLRAVLRRVAGLAPDARNGKVKNFLVPDMNAGHRNDLTISCIRVDYHENIKEQLEKMIFDNMPESKKTGNFTEKIKEVLTTYVHNADLRKIKPSALKNETEVKGTLPIIEELIQPEEKEEVLAKNLIQKNNETTFQRLNEPDYLNIEEFFIPQTGAQSSEIPPQE